MSRTKPLCARLVALLEYIFAINVPSKDLQQRCRVLIMTRERPPTTAAEPGEEDRRDFLKKCGKFAVITPPAVTLLLSTTLHSKAIAATSGTGSRPGWGFGDNNHGHTGPPGQNKNK